MNSDIPLAENDDSQETLRVIRQKAAEDPDFRDLCLSKPEAAVREAIGIDIPDDFTLRFVENKGADLTIVLPDEEFGDEDDLDSVAGGSGGESGKW